MWDDSTLFGSVVDLDCGGDLSFAKSVALFNM